MGPRRAQILTARTADKHDLYQRSVQSASEDASFLARRFRAMAGRPLRSFREDFCGTALLCCEMVRLHPENHALGIDLHGPTLRWARSHNLSRLREGERLRVDLMQRDVLSVRSPRVDLVAALNFSYWVFRSRPEMRAYFRNARRSLVPGGALVIDVYGGGNAQKVLVERTRLRGFDYVWDQAAFDPITHRILCRIHYEFPDGSRMRNAFTYRWRLWTLPELREMMDEAGFRDVHVLWEGTDRKRNVGNEVYRRSRRGTADPAWIAYLIGRA